MTPLTKLESHLQSRRVLRIPGRRKLIRAAVAVVVREDENGLSVLLTERARREADPWSGDMSFPGGRLQAGDAGGGAAACRETSEETGLCLDEHHRIGRLHDRITRAHRQPRPMVVSPFVYRYPENAGAFTLNHEVENTVWIPLAFLAAKKNRSKMNWKMGRIKIPVPCYDYQQYRVWGLTLLMLDELLRSANT